MNASVVVGQPDFVTSSLGAVSASSGLNGLGIHSDGTRLFLADFANNRVLIWNQIPTRNNVAADVVLGQPDFTSTTANNGGVGANTLRNPYGVFSDGTHLVISDRANNRILIWNSIPTTNQKAADVVVGQPDFTTVSSGVTASKINSPSNVWVDSGRLFITDRNNARVLIYNSIPTANGASADVVVGQDNFTTKVFSAAANRFSAGPRDVTVAGNKLIVSEYAARVLVWNSVPTSNGASADVVIGQSDFATTTANNGGVSCSSLGTNIEGVFVTSNGRLIIGDWGNARVLIFNQIPTSNQASADIVIGQPDCTSNTTNNGGVGAKTLSNNGNIVTFEVNQQLLVGDFGNKRILIFDNILTTPAFGFDGTPAGSTDGKLRMSGNVTVGGGSYNIWKVEASVNGGGYSSVSSLSEGIQNGHAHDPSLTQSVAAAFYHDFAPWSENNGTQTDWTNNQSTMLKDQGYTLKFRAYNTNADLAEHMFYFQPFSFNTLKLSTSCHSRENGNPDASSTGSPVKPGMTKECFPTLSLTPTLTFLVNQYQRTEMKENLDHYEVWIRKSQISNIKYQKEIDTSSNTDMAWEDWRRYITKIPVDYDTVKGYEDNQRRTDYVDNPGSGNGTYENNDLSVSFSKSSSIILVRKKNPNQDGTTLSSLTSGVYQVRVSAIDKHNHGQDSDPVTIQVRGLSINKNNLSVTTDWFPLQINSIQGAQTGILSSTNQYGIKDSYSTSTTTPTIKGIAFSNTKVTLLVADVSSDETRTYETTTKEDSTFIFTPTLYPNSLISLAVEDNSGKYNELPVFGLTVHSGVATDSVQGVQSLASPQKLSFSQEPILPTPKPNESPVVQTASSKKCFLWWC